MTDEDGVELYRMIKTVCEAVDVLLAEGPLRSGVARVRTSNAILARERLTEYQAMRRYMNAEVPSSEA